jgi:hypothetical protein
MNRLRASLLLAALLTLPSCRSSAPSRFPTPESAAISWILTRSDSLPNPDYHRRLPGRILLQETTQPDSTITVSFLEKALPQIDSASLSAFAESVRVVRRIEVAPANLPSPVILLPRKALLHLREAPGHWWNAWRLPLFGPHVQVMGSTAYILADGHTALMTVAARWASLDAEGHVVVLTQNSDGWAVTGSALLWVS